MPEKRMLILDAEVVKKIDENRGDMSYSEFINYLIDSRLKENQEGNNYATKEELQHLEQSLKEVLRTFLEFFISYGLELGKPPAEKEFAELQKKLHESKHSTSKA